MRASSEMDWWSFFSSVRGRINRAKYWLAILIFIVDVVLGLLEFVLSNAPSHGPPERRKTFLAIKTKRPGSFPGLFFCAEELVD